MRQHEGELRADLQEHYGIDLDHAMAGAHSPHHIAELCAHLPQQSRLMAIHDPDARWSLTDALLATIANALHNLMWGMSDKKKRGRRPKAIGPSWMQSEDTKSLPTRVVTIDQLMEELSKPRR